MADEVARQPVQQFRMRGLAAARAKVARRPDDATTEVPVPDAVHEDARRERMIVVDQPPGQLEPTARALGNRGQVGAGRQRSWRTARDLRTGRDGVVTPHMHGEVTRLFLLRHGEHHHGFRRHRLGQAIAFVRQGVDLRAQSLVALVLHGRRDGEGTRSAEERHAIRLECGIVQTLARRGGVTGGEQRGPRLGGGSDADGLGRGERGMIARWAHELTAPLRHERLCIDRITHLQEQRHRHTEVGRAFECGEGARIRAAHGNQLDAVDVRERSIAHEGEFVRACREIERRSDLPCLALRVERAGVLAQCVARGECTIELDLDRS